MDRPSVGNQLPIDFGLAHFRFETLDLSGRNKGIIGSVKRQDFASYFPGVLWSRIAQAAVKTNDCIHARARSRKLQDTRATETVANGTQPGSIHKLAVLQLL